MKISKITILSFVFLFFTNCRSLIATPPPPLFLPLKSYRLTERYAPRSRPSHQGIDLSAPKGTPVLSAHEGRVVYAGNRLSFYGKTIVIEYSKEWSSLYAHLDQIEVTEGTKVSKEQRIGTVGQTGRATGVHLHFELLYKKQPIDPIPYLRIK